MKLVVAAAEYIPPLPPVFSAMIDTGETCPSEAGNRDRFYLAGDKLSAGKGAADDSYFLIHDGVRPFVSAGLISVAEAAQQTGAAVPAVPPKDTIRHEETGNTDRSKLHCVQTPQGFRFGLICRAFEKHWRKGFCGTDDASLAERAGWYRPGSRRKREPEDYNTGGFTDGKQDRNRL